MQLDDNKIEQTNKITNKHPTFFLLQITSGNEVIGGWKHTSARVWDYQIWVITSMIKTPYYACTELAELSHRTMAIFQYNACTWCRYRLCISAPSTHRRFVLSVAQALTSAVTPVNSDTFITYDVQQRYAPSETRFWRYDV